MKLFTQNFTFCLHRSSWPRVTRIVNSPSSQLQLTAVPRNLCTPSPLTRPIWVYSFLVPTAAKDTATIQKKYCQHTSDVIVALHESASRPPCGPSYSVLPAHSRSESLDQIFLLPDALPSESATTINGHQMHP